jgi:hypothetical protein
MKQTNLFLFLTVTCISFAQAQCLTLDQVEILINDRVEVLMKSLQDDVASLKAENQQLRDYVDATIKINPTFSQDDCPCDFSQIEELIQENGDVIFLTTSPKGM